MDDGDWSECLTATFIILTQFDADTVRTETLNPIERVPTAATPNPVFILNTLVLADPLHVAQHDYLVGLPTMDITNPNFPPEPDMG